MDISINGKNVTLDGEVSVTKLLELQDVESPDMVSVQLNGEILDRSTFESTSVGAGDQVEFLYFMGGGSVHLAGGSAPAAAGPSGGSPPAPPAGGGRPFGGTRA